MPDLQRLSVAVLRGVVIVASGCSAPWEACG